jgi:hypothetical protein
MIDTNLLEKLDCKICHGLGAYMNRCYVLAPKSIEYEYREWLACDCEAGEKFRKQKRLSDG